MSTSSIWLLTARPTCYGTTEQDQRYRIYDSWESAEVIGWFETKDEAEEAMHHLYNSHNYEAFGPPKSALGITKVEFE